MKTALKNTGWDGKLLAHKMEWFNEPRSGDPTKVHRVTAYTSSDNLTVARQLENMQAVGIDGVISTWMGPKVNPFIHATCMETAKQCAERGMLFALLMDPWICKSGVTPQDKANLIATELRDLTTLNMITSGSYVPEMAVLDFSTGADLSLLRTLVPRFVFWERGIDYGWPNIDGTILNLAVQHTSVRMQVPAVCSGFFDGGRLSPVVGNGINGAGRNYEQGVWPNVPVRRVIDHQAGNFYLDTVGTLVNCKTARYAGLVTWNDHDEGTGIEQFISMLTGRRIV